MPSAVVFGARNLGGAIALGLLADGYRVASVARSAGGARPTRIRRRFAVPADVTDPEALASASDRRRSSSARRMPSSTPSRCARPTTGGPFGGGAIATAPPSAFDA